MAANLTYKCSNDCGIRIPLAISMPVFKPKTPFNLQKLPIRNSSLPYVMGYESDCFCLSCKQVVSVLTERSSEEIEYELALKRWNDQSLFMKLINSLRGLKRPIPAVVVENTETCPHCGAEESFLDDTGPCHGCAGGMLEIDNRLRAIY